MDSETLPEGPMEAYPEAAAILREAGWAPHNRWLVYTSGTLVMGFDHSGGFHVKDWAKVRPGDPQHSEDTPDDPVEAARWLVLRHPKPEPMADNPLSMASLEEPANDVAPSGEEGESAEHDEAADRSGEVGNVDNSAAGSRAEPMDLGATHDDVAPELQGPGGAESESPAPESKIEAIADADFDLISDEPAAVEGDNLTEAELLQHHPDLGAEIVADDPPSGVNYFGDNFDTMKLKKLGRLAQIAREKVAAIHGFAGFDDAEYAHLQNAVLHDTVDNIFRGDQTIYNRFMELSEAQGHINDVNRHRDQCTEYLESPDTPRHLVEQFDPEAGWPE